jgi:transcriptional regulator with XRE-family HTH domain
MKMSISNNFARLLEEKQQKENRFVPLAEVANEVKVSRRTLYKWQNNSVTRYDPNVIDALCRYFGVTLSELLDHTIPDEKPATKKKK